MKRQAWAGVFFLAGMFFWGTVSYLEAAVCPGTDSYAMIYYNHQLLNQYVSRGTFSQTSGLTGPVGIKIGPSGIVNAGNNILNRTIDLVITSADCDCLAETAESQVTVTVTGTCADGTLHMQIQEVYPPSSALVTCTGDDCPIYTQPYPGSTNSFDMDMAYIDGNLITQPYDCPNCSGMYSWRLQFTSKPPPADDIQPVPLAPLLHLMLRRANQ